VVEAAESQRVWLCEADWQEGKTTSILDCIENIWDEVRESGLRRTLGDRS
jgi:hypothetical protein